MHITVMIERELYVYMYDEHQSHTNHNTQKGLSSHQTAGCLLYFLRFSDRFFNYLWLQPLLFNLIEHIQSKQHFNCIPHSVKDTIWYRGVSWQQLGNSGSLLSSDPYPPLGCESCWCLWALYLIWGCLHRMQLAPLCCKYHVSVTRVQDPLPQVWGDKHIICLALILSVSLGSML